MVVFFRFLLDHVSEQIIAWAEVGITLVVPWIVDMARGIVAVLVWAHAVPHRFRKEQPKEK